MLEVVRSLSCDGRLRSMRDRQAHTRVQVRVDRLFAGHLGDVGETGR